jgi:SAM-dependent methyltransferase
VNEFHLAYLVSPEWAKTLETDLLPWVVSVGDLGDDVLEVGPGPGLTTDLLRRRVPKLTAVELDDDLAASLAERLEGTNVTVVHADATDAGLVSGRFSAATCFTMLHHMPTAEDQDRLFAEVHRMLRPGGLFVGFDSLDSPEIRLGHVDDIFNPVDAETLPGRLEAAGLADVRIEVIGPKVRFAARKAG